MKLSFINLIKWFYSYMTNWILFSLLLFMSNNFNYKYLFTLKLLLTYGFVGGLYITYINPKYIYVKYLDIFLKGKLLYICDFFCHILPLLYLNYWIYKNEIIIRNNSCIYFVLINLIYLTINDPIKLYNITWVDCYKIFIITMILSYL